jgi:uncharacterized protein with HEPN domain
VSKSTRQYLVDLRAYADKVAHFSSGGRQAFYADEMIQFAIIRAYEVIGEITKHIPTNPLALQPQIEWQDIKEFRDFWPTIMIGFGWILSGAQLKNYPF